MSLIDDLKRLHETMTGGEWRVQECGYNDRHESRGDLEVYAGDEPIALYGCPCSKCGGKPLEANANGIAELRNRLPEIIAELERTAE